MGRPTNYVGAASLLRQIETGLDAAQFTTGANAPASCSPGIGINEGEGALADPNNDWTLLDQDEDARTPQVGQYIGGSGQNDGTAGKGTEGINVSTNDGSGNGAVTPVDPAWLESLSAGWTAGDPTP